jgi:hypothetical protein
MKMAPLFAVVLLLGGACATGRARIPHIGVPTLQFVLIEIADCIKHCRPPPPPAHPSPIAWTSGEPKQPVSLRCGEELVFGWPAGQLHSLRISPSGGVLAAVGLRVAPDAPASAVMPQLRQ